MNDKMAQYRVATIEPWHVTEERFRPEMNEVAESIFSLANEYMGTRGNFEEGFSGATMPGCYLGGIYVKERQIYPWKRLADPTFLNSMINTVNWLEILVEVDGEALDLGTSQFSEYRRTLNLRQGLLSRQLVFTTRNGARTQLRWERFVSHDDPHLGAIRFSLTALNHTRPVKLTFALDGRKENRDHAIGQVHTRQLRQGTNADDAFLLTNFLTTGQYTIHWMRLAVPAIPGLKQEYHPSDKRVAITLTFTPAPGQEHIFDKLVSVWTSRDAGYPYGLIPKNEDRTVVDPVTEESVATLLTERSRQHLAQSGPAGYERARTAHAQEISHLWDTCDVEIDGDPAAQQGIRYCIFELLSAYQGRDSLLNIGPKGYSGENYNGRTFWDSESYCLPFYLFTNPAAARKLVEYRYLALPAARERAAEFRYRGAMYPMTTLDGTEDCALWEYTLGEIHINATIAYAIVVYTRVTGDTAYLYDRGLEVLIEIARFFASRAAFIPYRKGYAINRVMGPNEYGQCVNNNWYTNYMAKWVLESTLQVIGDIQQQCPDAWRAVVQRTGFDLAETEHWRDVAAKLILNYDPLMKVFIENDDFLSLDPFSREELDRERDIPIERKWTIEKYQKYQILKQPDVLLAMFLLRDRFSLAEKQNNYRFYEQRCVHGSSLSPAVHSILAGEVGRHNQAYEYYLWSSRLDLDDFNNNTHEGLHISSMSGAWLTIVCGFGGLVYTGPMLEFAPILPPAWTSYRFKFVYQGRTIQVGVAARQVSLQLLAGGNVRVKLYGQEVELTAHPLVVPLAAAYCQRPQPRAILFDLDGVIVDTARFHYLAWKKIADGEGIPFDTAINERLKGVSRRQSLAVILERAARAYGDAEIETLMEQKNNHYVAMLETLTSQDILPGIPAFLDELSRAGFKTAIVSASRNTNAILQRIGLEGRFDAVVTGDHTQKSKPDPEGMLLAAQRLGIASECCVVIEDAAAGLQAAVAAGMKCIGIGDKTLLYQADYTLPATRYLNLAKVLSLY